MATRDPILATPTPDAGVQRARWALNVGDRATIAAEVNVTSVGLLSIGAMVSSILLASAVIVLAARRPR